MRTDRGYSRLVSFSDGVVAIAITLLVLPLVDSAGDISTDVWTFMADNSYRLFVFVLSFVVIGRFWVVHHRIYENIVSYNTPLMWANLLWLLTIVFLPFPTELIATAATGDRGTVALYIGTMVLTCASSVLQQWIIIRSPQLQAEQVRGTLRLRPSVIVTVVMLVALLIAVTWPTIGLFALLLLTLVAPIEKVLGRSRRDPA